jgi:hypothetical protein
VWFHIGFGCNVKRQFLFLLLKLYLGDRARYPLKLRPKGLVTASIVVAELR